MTTTAGPASSTTASWMLWRTSSKRRPLPSWIERLLSNLTPEEQLVVDEMILHPYKNCTFDLMEQLECERTTIYKLRARAVKKLYRLYFGVGE